MNTQIITQFSNAIHPKLIPQADWVALAEACCTAYRCKADFKPVNREHILANVAAFQALAFYADKKTKTKWWMPTWCRAKKYGMSLPSNCGYYIGNFVKPTAKNGEIESTDTTLPGAIYRTIRRILDETQPLNAAEAAYFSRNLKVGLEQLTFKHSPFPVGEILLPYLQSLLLVAEGNI